MVGVAGELRQPPPRRTSGSCRAGTTVGTRATPWAAIWSMSRGDSPVPCSMQSMPGVDQVGQRLLAEDVGGDPGAPLVGRRHRGLERLPRPQRREVAGLALDPVADELDPAVAALGLLRDVRRPARRARPRGRSCGCSASGRARWRPARISRGRSSRSWIQDVSAAEPASRMQQRAGVAVGERLLLLDLGRHGAVRVEPDVAVRVDEPGDDPALGDELGRPAARS